MDLRVEPGARLSGVAKVPGDKSIAHRWLILAATAEGGSVLRGLPHALDVRSTAECMASLSGSDELASWATGDPETLLVEGRGWEGLRAPRGSLDCGNSGSTIRMICTGSWLF